MNKEEYVIYDNEKYKKTIEGDYVLLKTYDEEFKTNVTLKFPRKHDQKKLEEIQNNIAEALSLILKESRVS